jgi:hypothetical protein
MNLKLKAVLALAALAFGPFMIGTPASAGIVVGAPATGQNFIPFGSTAGYPEYQQVYASSNFPGTVTIDDLEFYTVPNSGTGNPNTGVITISLSTTSASVNGLSTNLSQNIGSDNTTVYDAKLPAVQNGVLTIPLSTPFTYDPAGGNLLIDIFESTPYTGGPAFEFNGASGGVFSRAYSGQTIPVTNDSGLVTGFNASVPEPSTWALMILGLVGLGFAGYRKSKRRLVGQSVA